MIYKSCLLQRTYAERIRGEARKKWLQQVVTSAETGGASMEPVYKSVFQALYKVGVSMEPVFKSVFQALYKVGVSMEPVYKSVFQALYKVGVSMEPVFKSVFQALYKVMIKKAGENQRYQMSPVSFLPIMVTFLASRNVRGANVLALYCGRPHRRWLHRQKLEPWP